ncbi:hypothetical protein LIN78_01525 [Leeia sp. TBRC 13508]|uniref:Uncharacterized protein n=1 Tax=Leeia speluncae TaxID=2884804 RepID=A0ABS8D206_9NEIS|nr:hypothetical protein [Leeia speluncae]MCB6182236.1 hypothetical protein [Leeia speluncae]
MNKRKYITFTYVYGEKFWMLMCQILLKSLLCPDFVSFIRQGRCEIYIFTSDADIPETARPLIEQYNKIFNFKVLSAKNQTEALLLAIKHCSENNTSLIMLPPDTYFASGSITRLVDLNDLTQAEHCYAAPHIRVDSEKFINGLSYFNGVLDSASLVELGLKTLHSSWDKCILDETSTPEKSYLTGAMLLNVGKKYYIQHRLPTYWLVNFRKSDFDHFFRGDFYHWDCYWPNKIMAENRHKAVGSSSVFCAVELTSEDTHEPLAFSDQEERYDDYVHRSHSTDISGMFIYELK